MAHVTGYSSRHLYSKFKEETGVTLTDYIRLRKLTLASFMLRRSGRTVTDIVFMYGFDSIQHFSRIFKSHFGISPRAFRNADSWNMNLFFPSAIVTEFSYTTKICNINNKAISAYFSDVIDIDYGFNFLLSSNQGKIITAREIADYYMNMFTNIASNKNHFTVLGEVVPVKGLDVRITTYIGQVSSTPSSSTDHIKIPDRKYICFNHIGALPDIIDFHTWAAGHGLRKHQCWLSRGPTFTTFTLIDSYN
ncbi:helix-turn-helix transcriptional regulator, partial [Salmonella enterica subsp. enterica serovar Give]|nr:helix-turn-helix transcriptional regulator [Salmonella enterica subsp. enterica serovar Give]EJM4013611.1 helix-turn-helix transcriptional regulator [Salmonella enterica]EJO0214532.1 helix-turn-helix transcriptional regulator [Salmonella enterica]